MAHKPTRTFTDDSLSAPILTSLAVPCSAAVLIIEIHEWLKRRKMLYEVGFYTLGDWQQRRERFGNSAPVTLTSELRLGKLLNGTDASKGAQDLYAEFGEFCADRGWYWEMGYSWSIHFLLIP